jgi:hypothetical protein
VAAGTWEGAWQHKAIRRWQRWRGTVAIEDFNAMMIGPVAQQPAAREQAGTPADAPVPEARTP